MTEEQIALARRAVVCKGWRWMPGMRATLSSGLVVRLADHDEGSLWWATITGGATCIVDMRHPSYTVAPDLSDPATVGCLLALVREAWVDECAGHTYDEFWNGWFFKSRVRDGDGGNVRILGQFRSEAEALVVALEAAP